jgi:DNA-binding transcriptional regulator of glucitol operon
METDTKIWLVLLILLVILIVAGIILQWLAMATY